MDIKIIFIKTKKGEDESRRITNYLSSDIKRALGLIDNKSSVKELMKRAAPSLRESLGDMLQELVNGGYIQDKDKISNEVKMAIPRAPVQKNASFFSKIIGAKDRENSVGDVGASDAGVEAARLKAEQEAVKAKAEQEAARIKAEQEAAQAKAKKEAEAKAHAEAEAARLKAEQEAAKAKAEQEAAKAKAEQEAAKAKAEQEAAKVKAEQEAAKVKAEQEAAKVKAEQEAAKAKAEQEAAKARVKKEEETKAQGAQVPEMKAAQSVAAVRKKPLPLGKIVVGLILLLLVSVVLLPYVWPMQGYITQIEQKLSAQLQQPVHIGRLHATLLPQPKLEFENVSIGNGQELKAGSVKLSFNLFELFNEIKPVRSLEISNAVLSTDDFDKVLLWLQGVGGDSHYPVARMVFQRARASNDELGLPLINGEVNFDGQRRFAKVALKSEDGKLGMEMQPQQAGWQIAVSIKESYIPMLPDILFNELTMKGELVADGIKFHEIDGQLYGGQLTGSAYLTWQKGWRVQGLVNTKVVKLDDALPKFGIAGEMDSDINFILRGEKLSQLADAPHLDGNILVKKGLISTIDMIETSRMSTRKSASNGRTHFDELSGMLQVDNNVKHLRQIKISSSVMSVSGSVDVAANKQLSGRLNVDLKIRADLGSTPLTLSGTPTGQVWNVRR